MPNNYRYRLNKGEPSKQEIQQHMDFDDLLASFEEKRPQPKVRHLRIRRLVYMAGAAAAAVLLIFGVRTVMQQTIPTLDEDAYFASQPYIDTPLANIIPKNQTQSIEVYEGGVLEYPSGSKLVIPSAAFMNDRGQLIGGQVDIHYKEMLDGVDFFAAGIPMMYDSAGMQRHLTSTGIIEVYATQNGQRVFLAPEKTIQVELRSEVIVDDYFTAPSYSVYSLDTAARTWRYEDLDVIQFLEEEALPVALSAWQQQLDALEAEHQQSIDGLESVVKIPHKPGPPAKASGDRPTFELSFQNGELALDPASVVTEEDIRRLHENTIWEIVPESPPVNPNAFLVTWESVRLIPAQNGNYQVTFIHQLNAETILARPVLLGQDFDKAQTDYQTQLADYEQAVADRNALLKDQLDSLQNDFDARRQSIEAAMEEDLTANPNLRKRKIINRFELNKAGLWNCAVPLVSSEIEKVVSYKNDTGKSFEQKTAYLINENHNTLFRFYATPNAEIRLMPDSKNTLWIVNENGQISVARFDDMANLEDPVTIQLNEVQSSITSLEELRKVLKH